MGLILHVVSHTHWDREWYLTFQQFRLRLVDLIDHLLDILEQDPQFHHFSLDAQTIVLEDYLQIRPQARARLEEHIRAGRIAVGPWYQLNDEFLVSGEATVRSLLTGHRMAQAFGACMKVGYLPDQFGNLSQMPQILRGFGIDNAIMGRGYQLVGDRKMEFWWESPDGSRVLASLMAFWYNNAQYIPEEPGAAAEFIAGLRDTMAPRSAVSHLLLMNGVDHLEAKPFIGRTIGAVQESLERQGKGDALLHSTLTQYVDALRDEVTGRNPPLARVVGELREDRGGACLAGTLSTRMYLKQANHLAQIALEQYTERLSAFARAAGAPYPYDPLLYAWKLLMQNHPHDSICGCSDDQVHREMMPRFKQVEQVGAELTERALDTLTGRDRTRGATEDATALAVFNTLNWLRTDPVTVTLEFPLGAPARGNAPRDDAKAPRGFTLLDPDGNEIAFAVTHTETVVRTVSNPHELPLDQWVQRITIEFIAADVPSCGYKTYTLAPQPAMPHYPPAEAMFHDGIYLSYEDVGDVGDEYLHRKPLRDTVCTQSLVSGADESELNAVRNTITQSLLWELPASADLQSRSPERVPCRITTRQTFWSGVPRVEYETVFENHARDHRLRAVFSRSDFSYEMEPQSYSEGQFDTVARPIQHPLEAEGALPFHPQQSWTALVGRTWGMLKEELQTEENRDRMLTHTLSVLNRGLPEFEVYETDSVTGPALAVTLLRCVGQLSGRGDGPGIPTPDAQCPGAHTFRFALYHGNGDWKEARVWKQAHQFNTPLVAVQCPADPERPSTRSFLSVEHPRLVVTALKRAEDRDTLIVRFFNVADETVNGAAATMPGARRARLVNLNEEPQEAWRDSDTLRLDVGPKKIVTVEFEV